MKLWERVKQWKHQLLGCALKSVGWTTMGNPIEQCRMCGQHFVTYGIVGPMRIPVTAEMAQTLNMPLPRKERREERKSARAAVESIERAVRFRQDLPKRDPLIPGE